MPLATAVGHMNQGEISTPPDVPDSWGWLISQLSQTFLPIRYTLQGTSIPKSKHLHCPFLQELYTLHLFNSVI